MAPAYRLIYFDLRARAEAARYLFKYGGIDFEDVRVSRADWPKIKNDTPFGQVPVLEHEGKQVAQSVAICRYIAKLVKLTGKNQWEDLEIDAIVDAFGDFRQTLRPIFFEADEQKKKVLLEEALKDSVPFYLKRFDEIVRKNGGYFVGGHLTWADVFWTANGQFLDVIVGKEVIEDYPNLKGLAERVNELPAIKAWIAERPNNDF